MNVASKYMLVLFLAQHASYDNSVRLNMVNILRIYIYEIYDLLQNFGPDLISLVANHQGYLWGAAIPQLTVLSRITKSIDSHL